MENRPLFNKVANEILSAVKPLTLREQIYSYSIFYRYYGSGFLADIQRDRGMAAGTA